MSDRVSKGSGDLYDKYIVNFTKKILVTQDVDSNLLRKSKKWF